MIAKPKIDLSQALVSPMPGQLISVNVVPGQVVEIGQELCVVEAMKMQNLLRSTRKGKVCGPRVALRLLGGELSPPDVSTLHLPSHLSTPRVHFPCFLISFPDSRGLLRGWGDSEG